jgi:hypothetical protein
LFSPWGPAGGGRLLAVSFSRQWVVFQGMIQVTVRAEEISREAARKDFIRY